MLNFGSGSVHHLLMEGQVSHLTKVVVVHFIDHKSTTNVDVFLDDLAKQHH